MQRRTPIALLLCLAAFAIVCLPANAVTIHKHTIVHRVVGHDPEGPVKVAQEVVRVQTVPPADSDDDGCPDAQDSYNGPGCNPPPKPAPTVAAPVQSVAPSTPTTTSVPTASGGYTIPSYIVSCESGGNYSAVGPYVPGQGSAVGAYQIMPATASAYGCDLSTASGQDQCAAEIYADVGSSAWSCG